MAAFPFPDLPPELRNKIYGYLLSTKYTKIELTYHRKSLRDSLPRLMPPHHYCFHTGILGVNRQINSEAADVLYRTNLFVSLTSNHPEFDTKMAGVVVVATGHHASNFKHHSMEVHLSRHWDSDDGSHHPCKQLIIAGDDVPHFCNILPGVLLGHMRPGAGQISRTSTNVCVQINIKRIADIENENTGPSKDSPSAKRLLEPFCRLYGMRVRVEGHVTLSYKDSIEQCAARQPPTAADLVPKIFKDRKEGNEAIKNGDLITALVRYESAFDLWRSGWMRLTVLPVTVETLGLPEKETLAQMRYLRINLRSLLASTYLELGQPVKSYRCAQDLKLTKVLARHKAFRSVWSDCAHIMFCKALAGKTLGQPVQALLDLEIALEFPSSDETMKRERELLRGWLWEKMNGFSHIKTPIALDLRWRDVEALIKNKSVA